MPKQDEYRTKDIYLGSLLTLFEKLIRLELGDNFFWFVFADKTSCEIKETQFWNGEIKVEAKSFINAIKDLKSRVFAENRRRPKL